MPLSVKMRPQINRSPRTPDARSGNRLTSADSPFARRHNIGFRCALSACDLNVLGDGLVDERVETIVENLASLAAASQGRQC